MGWCEMQNRCMHCMKEYTSSVADQNESVCPNCGYKTGTPQMLDYFLKPGTLLHDRYDLGVGLGYNGRFITYKAWDRTCGSNC